MAQKFANNAVSRLAAALSDTSATTFAVLPSEGAKFPALAVGDWCMVTVIKSNGQLEIMKATARTTDQFTVIRAQEGTAALPFSAGDRVEARFTAGSADAMWADINAKLPLAGGKLAGNVDVDQAAGAQLSFPYGGADYAVARGAPGVPGWIIANKAGDHLLRVNLTTKQVDIPSGNFNAFSQTYLNGRVHAMPGPGATNQGEVRYVASNGTSMCIRGRASGGLEYVNNAYTAVPYTFADNGDLTIAGRIYAANGMAAGGAQFGNDGNVYMPFRGQWLSDALGGIQGTANDAWNKANDAQVNRAYAGAQVHWNSGVVEFARLTSGSSGNGTADSGDPWVMCGMRIDGWGIILRAVWLRNN